ncbi:MAG TPA: AAA family ATPase [Candidatus Saccharimonadales bacterium]|nr:AAA family ATPase [Candidatus Saccharimonadales bacterium]
MDKPKLYLLIGYPGAGKTTVSKYIAEYFRASHIWADHERQLKFGHPTHSNDESIKLYEDLNHRVEKLLSQGKSVVFDTNFNFFADRQKLREIAERYGAKSIILWVTLAKELAKSRAVDIHDSRNGYPYAMTDQQFESIVSKLQPPRDNEKFIKIDGTKLDRQTVIDLVK